MASGGGWRVAAGPPVSAGAHGHTSGPALLTPAMVTASASAGRPSPVAAQPPAAVSTSQQASGFSFRTPRTPGRTTPGSTNNSTSGTWPRGTEPAASTVAAAAPAPSSSAAPGARFRIAQGLRQADRTTWNNQLAALQRGGLSVPDFQNIMTAIRTVLLPSAAISKQDCSDMIAALCDAALSLSDAAVSAAVVNFSLNVGRHMRISLKTNQLDAVIPFHLRRLASHPEDNAFETLKSLSFVLFENADRCSKFYTDILTALRSFIWPVHTDVDINHAALLCYANVCAKAGTKLRTEYAELITVCSALLTHWVDSSVVVEPEQRSKVLGAALRVLNCMLQGTRDAPASFLDRYQEILRSLRVLIGHGLVAATARQTPRPSGAPPGFGREESKDGGAGSWRTSATRPAALPARPSDSEMSDADHDATTEPRDPDLRVRTAAVACLHHLARAAPALVQDRWLWFLAQAPVGPPKPDAAPTLQTLVLYDPSARAREAAAAAIGAMIDTAPLSKMLPLQVLPATGRATVKSDQVAGVIQEIHRTLVSAIRSSSEASAVITQCIKTLTVVAGVTPYERFPPELLNSLVEALQPLLTSREQSICVAAMACVGTIMVVPHSPHVAAQLQYTASMGSSVSTIMDAVLRTANTAPVAARVEALSVLCKAVKHYEPQLSSAWKPVINVLLASFRDADPNVRAHGLRLVEHLLQHRQATTTGSSADDDDEVSAQPTAAEDSKAGAPLVAPAALQADAWQSIVSFSLKHLSRALSDAAPAVRAVACMCCSYLLAADLQLLSADDRKAWMGLFAACCKDDTQLVRGSACRAFGTFVQCPDTQTTDTVTAITTALLECLADTALAVRVRAVWALSNVCTLCESLATTSRRTLLSHTDLKRLCIALIGAATDSDKVSALAVRALGHAGGCLHACASIFPMGSSDSDASPSAGAAGSSVSPSKAPTTSAPATAAASLWSLSDAELIQAMVTTIGKTAITGSVKVQWNSCYALGWLMQATDAADGSGLHLQHALTTLQTRLNDSPNYKVRIAAAQALCSVPRRSAFGPGYSTAVQSVFMCLQAVKDVHDFELYRYKDVLERQLTSSLVHLLTLVTPSDFASNTDFWMTQAQALFDWIVGLDQTGPLATAIHAATVGMARMYGSRVKTIPVELLRRYQAAAFGADEL